MPAVSFFSEQIPFRFPQKRRITAWLRHAMATEGYALVQLNIVFCSDDYLLHVNREYLQHDYLTDIITFDQSETALTVEGDVFISIDRVRENATLFAVPFLHELHRVLIHGALHLMGYRDDSNISKREMRDKEDFYLGLLDELTRQK